MRYDTFTSFYDPNQQYATPQELTAELLEAKQSAHVPSYLDAVDAKGLLYAEATHLGLHPHDIPLSIDEHQAKYISAQIGTFVARVLRATEISSRELEKKQDYLQPAIAGVALALCAHYESFRGNGRPYITHPQAVAKQIEIVQKRYNFLSKQELQSDLFVAFTHDAFEDTVPASQNETFLSSPNFCVSPYIAEQLFRQIDESQAHKIARSLYLVSKPTGSDGKMPYDTYIARGRNDRIFRTVKLADIHHNGRLDPKPAYTRSLEFSQKTYQKQRDYRQASYELLRSIDDDRSYDLKSRLAHHAIQTLTTKDLRDRMPFSDSFTTEDAGKVADIFASHVSQPYLTKK